MAACIVNNLVRRFFSGEATVEERLEFLRRLLKGDLDGAIGEYVFHQQLYSLQHPAMLLLTVSVRERWEASKTKARTLERILRWSARPGTLGFGVIILIVLHKIFLTPPG